MREANPSERHERGTLIALIGRQLVAMFVALLVVCLFVHAAPAYAQFSHKPQLWQDQQRDDAKWITIRQVNLFHRHFIDKCMPVLPDRFEVQYLGLLSTNNGRKSLEVAGDLGNPLAWAVQDKLVLFTVWISTKSTELTVAKCVLDEKTLFVNVDFVDSNRSPHEKLPELDSHSIVDILVRLGEKASPPKSTD